MKLRKKGENVSWKLSKLQAGLGLNPNLSIHTRGQKKKTASEDDFASDVVGKLQAEFLTQKTFHAKKDLVKVISKERRLEVKRAQQRLKSAESPPTESKDKKKNSTKPIEELKTMLAFVEGLCENDLVEFAVENTPRPKKAPKSEPEPEPESEERAGDEESTDDKISKRTLDTPGDGAKAEGFSSNVDSKVEAKTEKKPLYKGAALAGWENEILGRIVKGTKVKTALQEYDAKVATFKDKVSMVKKKAADEEVRRKTEAKRREKVKRKRQFDDDEMFIERLDTASKKKAKPNVPEGTAQSNQALRRPQSSGGAGAFGRKRPGFAGGEGRGGQARQNNQNTTKPAAHKAAPAVPKEPDGPVHPSWEAKQKQKAALTQGFSGKKIVFD